METNMIKNNQENLVIVSQNTIQKGMKAHLEQDYVELSEGSWQNNLEQVKEMKEWKVAELLIWNNFRSNIIQEINHIHFPKLSILDLSTNTITTIDPITRVHMPNLTVLSLMDNQLTSLKSITNCIWPNLSSLFFANNYARDCDSLFAGAFPCLVSLWVDNVEAEESQYVMSNVFDLRMSKKFQSTLFTQPIYHQSRYRLQNHFMKMMDKDREDSE